MRALRLVTNALPSSGSRCAAALGSASPSHLGRRGSKNLDWYINAVAAKEAAKDAPPDPPVFPPETLHGKKRARAFIDFQTGTAPSDSAASSTTPVDRVVVELADDLVPLAVQNFLQLCERPQGQGYKGSEIFYVRKGVGITMGDWVRGDGRGGHSAFGSRRFFVDENFVGRHSAPGVLSYANSGVHTNNSVFMITLSKQPQLDGRHVVFGRVLTGMDVVNKIGNAFLLNMKPATPVVIRNAGRLLEGTPEWAAVDKAIAASQPKAAAAKPAAGPAAGKKAAAAAAPASA